MTPEEYCRATQAAIASPERWCKGDYTRYNEDGTPRAFCSIGALSHVGAELQFQGEITSDDYKTVRFMLDEKALELGHMGIVPFNDHEDTTHADLMALFEKAAAALAEKVD